MTKALLTMQIFVLAFRLGLGRIPRPDHPQHRESRLERLYRRKSDTRRWELPQQTIGWFVGHTCYKITWLEF